MDGYSRFLTRHPLLTKSLTCSILLSVGDAVSQVLDMWNHRELHRLDAKRLGTMAVFGGVYLGPVLHVWYSFVLGRCFPVPGLLTAAKKTVMDQAIFAPFGFVTFFTGLTLLNGGTWAQAHGKLQKELWSTLMVNWSVWPVVQAFNFALVPIPYQVLVVNTVAIVWNSYLSYVQFKK